MNAANNHAVAVAKTDQPPAPCQSSGFSRSLHQPAPQVFMSRTFLNFPDTNARPLCHTRPEMKPRTGNYHRNTRWILFRVGPRRCQPASPLSTCVRHPAHPWMNCGSTNQASRRCSHWCALVLMSGSSSAGKGKPSPTPFLRLGLPPGWPPDQPRNSGNSPGRWCILPRTLKTSGQIRPKTAKNGQPDGSPKLKQIL